MCSRMSKDQPWCWAKPWYMLNTFRRQEAVNQQVKRQKIHKPIFQNNNYCILGKYFQTSAVNSMASWPPTPAVTSRTRSLRSASSSGINRSRIWLVKQGNMTGPKTRQIWSYISGATSTATKRAHLSVLPFVWGLEYLADSLLSPVQQVLAGLCPHLWRKTILLKLLPEHLPQPFHQTISFLTFQEHLSLRQLFLFIVQLSDALDEGS